MRNHFIVMGDVVRSRTYPGNELVHSFKRLVSLCNEKMSPRILSPYTITLGDEFQGVADSLYSAVESILCFEEMLLREELLFRLRYVVVYGAIETRLNRKIAYGMIGPGLTRARELLTAGNKSLSVFELPDPDLAVQLNRLFNVIASLIKEWNAKDWKLIRDMIKSESDAQIAAKYQKNRSQVWKRRRALHIDDYKALKEVILYLSRRTME